MPFDASCSMVGSRDHQERPIVLAKDAQGRRSKHLEASALSHNDEICVHVGGVLENRGSCGPRRHQHAYVDIRRNCRHNPFHGSARVLEDACAVSGSIHGTKLWNGVCRFDSFHRMHHRQLHRLVRRQSNGTSRTSFDASDRSTATSTFRKAAGVPGASLATNRVGTFVRSNNFFGDGGAVATPTTAACLGTHDDEVDRTRIGMELDDFSGVALLFDCLHVHAGVLRAPTHVQPSAPAAPLHGTRTDHSQAQREADRAPRRTIVQVLAPARRPHRVRLVN